MNRLNGKVALVTGGSSGIGRAAAIAFAREGAKVVLAARGEERGHAVAREIAAAGGDALFVAADVSKGAEVKALVETAVARYGRLDCALNNAALREGMFSLTADFQEEEFERVVSVNLKGVWLCMKHEIRQMLRQSPRGGAIVNTSSVNGLGGVPQASFYAATKAGILALGKSAALEYAREGIRVNLLVAGAFETPMLLQGMDRLADDDPGGRAGVRARYEGLIPLGRIGSPAEAAEAIVWLCSDAASYVTGHSMIVDGGLSAPMR